MDFSPTGLRPARDGPYDWGPAMSDRQDRLRLTAALATSAAFHLAVFLFLVHSARVAEFLADALDIPRVKLIPVSLVSRPGGGGGGPLPGNPSPALARAGNPPPSSEPLVAPKPSPPPPPLPTAEAKSTAVATPNATALGGLRALAAPVHVPARVQPAAPTRQEATAPPAATGSTGPTRAPSAGGSADRVASLGGDGAGGNGGRGGPGSGDGSGGDGSDAMARPAYGTNPKPPYPLAARRLGVEGVVTLEVLVRPDGSPGDVRVQSSSGSPLLDASALETVRKSWRFLPARRGNVPIESRVTFPVRFRLSEG
jgi:periplasmic protein TonB